MRANPLTIGLLTLTVSALSAHSTPAAAQARSRAAMPTVIRVPLPGSGTAIALKRSCDRPLDRSGRMINALIQSYDSTSGVLMVSTNGFSGVAFRFPEPAFQASTCLPIERHDGRRETLSALVPEKLIGLWVSDLVIPTQPPQYTLLGIEIYDLFPRKR